MSNKVGVLILHGIGNQAKDKEREPEGYSIKLQQGVEEIFNGSVKVQEILYSQEFDYVDTRKKKLLSSSYKWQWITRFMRWILIYVLGDANSYKDKTTYFNVHKILFDGIEELKKGLDQDALIIIVAHSLGVRVVSDYIYDEQHGITAPDLAELAKLHDKVKIANNLRAIVSFGCNIPLFETGQKKTVSIKRPNDKFEWLNFFSPFDPLGYEMANYYDEEFGNSSNKPTFIKDEKVFSGGLLKSWNFFSHTAYWECKEISSAISQIIKGENL